MSGNVGDVSRPFACGFRDIHQVSANFAAGLRHSVEFELACALLDCGNQRCVNLSGKLNFGLDAKIALSQASHEKNEQEISRDNRKHCAEPKTCKLMLQYSGVARQALRWPCDSASPIFKKELNYSQSCKQVEPSRDEAGRIPDCECPGQDDRKKDVSYAVLDDVHLQVHEADRGE